MTESLFDLMTFRNGSGTTALGEEVLTTTVDIKAVSPLFAKHHENRVTIMSPNPNFKPTQPETILVNYPPLFAEEHGLDAHQWYLYSMNENLLHLQPIATLQHVYGDKNAPVRYALTLAKPALDAYIATLPDKTVAEIEKTYDTRKNNTSAIYVPKH